MTELPKPELTSLSELKNIGIKQNKKKENDSTKCCQF